MIKLVHQMMLLLKTMMMMMIGKEKLMNSTNGLSNFQLMMLFLSTPDDKIFRCIVNFNCFITGFFSFHRSLQLIALLEYLAMLKLHMATAHTYDTNNIINPGSYM